MQQQTYVPLNFPTRKLTKVYKHRRRPSSLRVVCHNDWLFKISAFSAAIELVLDARHIIKQICQD
jgi:hypothetical protein